MIRKGTHHEIEARSVVTEAEVDALHEQLETRTRDELNRAIRMLATMKESERQTKIKEDLPTTPLYWVIKDRNDEFIGLYEDSTIVEEVTTELGELIGHQDWWWETITQAEFETYREFGLKEYKLDS